MQGGVETQSTRRAMPSTSLYADDPLAIRRREQSPLRSRESYGAPKPVAEVSTPMASHLSNQLSRHPSAGTHSVPGSPRPPNAFSSTSPPMTPSMRFTPESHFSARSLATSPLSSHLRSPTLRSTPLTSNRRRYSEQSFASGSLSHHSPGPNFGSFVGSYEESLLSGRMSSLPSKPLVFDAELGVLGFGKCKASLKCPPHLNITFPAHFYSLDLAADKEGSASLGTPYVGTVDIEGHYLDTLLASQMSGLGVAQDSPVSSVQQRAQPAEAPSFPGYQVPPKGQIQLVIKNPNCTAVKLFLVPYDFTDMPAGTKTFIRQKSHVASPGSGTDNIEGTSPSLPRAKGRQSGARETLRYAVHLQFCAVPSRQANKKRQSEPGFNPGGLDRLNHRRKSDESQIPSKKATTNIYLHKNIRVVFAARIPDSTEKLRVVTETPGGSDGDPSFMYSTYHGPSDEWKEAKRVRRAHRAASIDPIKLEEEELERGLDSFTDGISDPNGEKWFANGTPDGVESSSPPLGLDIPLTSRSPWREEEGRSRLTSHGADEMASRSSAPTVALGFPSAAFDNGKRSTTPFGVSHVKRRSTSPDERERAEESRALLGQWHASLASRPQDLRPASPAPHSRPTSPTIVKGPTSPPTPTGKFYTLMNRSSSSQGSVSNVQEGGLGKIAAGVAAAATISSSPAPRLSGMFASRQATSLRPLTPQRTGEGQQQLPSPLHGPPAARPAEAALDLDHANGVMEAQTSPVRPSFSDSGEAILTAAAGTSTTPRRPSLLRRLSSQSQLGSR